MDTSLQAAGGAMEAELGPHAGWQSRAGATDLGLLLDLHTAIRALHLHELWPVGSAYSRLSMLYHYVGLPSYLTEATF